MEIKLIKTGILSTNTYLLKNKDENILIDPSGKADKLMDYIDGKLVAILLTHGHFDHIKAVDGLYQEYHCPIYLNHNDFDLVDKNLCNKTNSFMGLSAYIKSPISNIKNGQYQIASFNFEVIEVKGHTMGSVLYRFGKDVFCGDTLFKEAVGRCDLYGGNQTLLSKSLKLFKDLDANTIIYPGHDEITTLAYELEHNPYLK